jgi:hypothetical protein
MTTPSVAFYQLAYGSGAAMLVPAHLLCEYQPWQPVLCLTPSTNAYSTGAAAGNK